MAPTYPDVVTYIRATPQVELSAQAAELHEKINRRIGAADSLPEVMQVVFDASCAEAAWDRLGLAFIEEDGSRASAIWNRALYQPMKLQTGYAEGLQGSSLAEILATGAVRVINDLEAYLQAHPASRSTRLLLEEGVRANLTCPLYVDQRPIGFLFRSARRPYAFGPHDVALNALIAERLAQVVDKAWRIEELRRANHGYLEMLGFITHELKSPLASMISSSQLLSEGFLGKLQPRQQERLQRIRRQGEHLMELVRQYFELARLEQDALPNLFLHVDLRRELIEPVLEIVTDEIALHGMSLECELPGERVMVHCCADQLRLVLINLLTNAVRYGEPGGTIRLVVELEHGEIAFTVWNRGPGFRPEDQPRLFRKFSRLESTQADQKGSGLGLYTCWRLVNHHGGTISADSTPGEWAAFTVHLPQPIPRHSQLSDVTLLSCET